MCAQPSLLAWQKALTITANHSPEPSPVTMPLVAAHGLVIAEDVVSAQDIPLFTSSAMDGFAVIADDVKGASLESAVTLEVIGEARAGQPFRGEVEHGQAVEIMTGAPLPAGADTVVKVEETQRISERQVRIFSAAPPATAVRIAGRDFRKGELLVHRGEKLTAGLAALLAAAGIGEVAVYPRPKVGIVVTGDELMRPGRNRAQMEFGAIFDANSVMLELLVKEIGADVIFCEWVKDDPGALSDVFRSQRGDYDILILSGGVSKGKYDYVRPLFSDCGGEVLFWGVNQQPGKPLLVGKLDGKLVFGLPGNPVSAFFCADLYLRTALRRMSGESDVEPIMVTVLLGEELCKNDERLAFRRAYLSARGKRVIAYASGPSDSNLVHTIARHHGYILIPPERARIRQDEPVQFLLPDPTRVPKELLKTLLSLV
ncbi:MAG: gephyrin-like molybdotransferase Glp [Candidatus Sumerlaeaceae bacterium]